MKINNYYLARMFELQKALEELAEMWRGKAHIEIQSRPVLEVVEKSFFGKDGYTVGGSHNQMVRVETEVKYWISQNEKHGFLIEMPYTGATAKTTDLTFHIDAIKNLIPLAPAPEDWETAESELEKLAAAEAAARQADEMLGF